MAQLIRNGVPACEYCVIASGKEKRLILQLPQRLQLRAPKGDRQVDFIPKFTLSSGYENIVLGMNLIFRFMFPVPTLSQVSQTVAEVIFFIMMKYGLLPTTIISNKTWNLFYQLIKRCSGCSRHHSGKSLDKTSTDDWNAPKNAGFAQKKTMKIETVERRPMWQKFVYVAVPNN